MRIIKNLITKLTKQTKEEKWLSYYSKENRKIKFTDKTIYDYLIDSVGQDKDFYALNYFGTRMTYNEMFEKIDLAAKSLKTMGVKKDDIVTICMPNTPEAVIAFYAINKIGAIADMIHPLSSQEEIKHYLNESQSRIMFLIDFNYPKVENIIDDTKVFKTIMMKASTSMPPVLKFGYTLTKGLKTKRPRFTDIDYISWNEFMLKGISYTKEIKYEKNCEDVGIILHSGGTTGKPKGIMITNYSFNALAMQGGVNVSDARPQDKIVTLLPIFHGFGLGVCVHCPLCLKVETILVPEYDGKRFHDMMKKERPHVLAGVPTLWEGMMDRNYDDVDMSNLKYVISGGDILTLNMEKRMNSFLRSHKANIAVSKGYGMTESTAATAYTYDGTNEPGSIGIPMIGNEFKIIDVDTKKEVKAGVEGEIMVSGPTLMKGYLNNEEETNLALEKDSLGKTWLHTGDLGYISPNGIIYFTQRLKRMIVSSGFNVYPGMIEETIESHSKVKKCCVVGIPHEYKMEVAKAFIILNNGEKPTSKLRKELKDLCKKNLAAYSQPKEFEFRETLPKTLYNKIDFKSLEKEEREKYEKNK